MWGASHHHLSQPVLSSLSLSLSISFVANGCIAFIHTFMGISSALIWLMIGFLLNSSSRVQRGAHIFRRPHLHGHARNQRQLLTFGTILQLLNVPSSKLKISAFYFISISHSCRRSLLCWNWRMDGCGGSWNLSTSPFIYIFIYCAERID